MDEQRRWLEAEPDIAERTKLYCFLRGITIKAFVTKALREALMPYEGWIENFKKLRTAPEEKQP